MTDDSRRKPAPGVPRTPGTSPLWYGSAAAAVVLAFAVGVWFDRRTPDPPAAGSMAEAMPPGHPPIGGGAAPAAGGARRGDYDPTDPEQVWAASCAVCHGASGEPTPAAVGIGTPDLRDPARLAGKSDEELERRIREGGTNMPSYGDTLPDETVDALVRKVRSLSGS